MLGTEALLAIMMKCQRRKKHHQSKRQIGDEREKDKGTTEKRGAKFWHATSQRPCGRTFFRFIPMLRSIILPMIRITRPFLREACKSCSSIKIFFCFFPSTKSRVAYVRKSNRENLYEYKSDCHSFDRVPL